ncbi:MAG: LLM class flavin-dependent oxidoreductase, partial [Alphaproteobacteria bacterium]|nr:LLM class flavin-dependent oxidoreductase [Alphaproteobacteria bacterium]
DEIWLGDHVSFAIPFLDPLLMIAQAAVASRRLVFGTGVYLLPLRHPGPVAKMTATLDHLSEGRFIFGVGVGGEFPKEYEVCGVPREERGHRLTESIEAVRALWSGRPASYCGRHFSFKEVPMLPPPRQTGGPPIWCGGRRPPALRRAGRLADGYVSYVVTPDMFARALAEIDGAAEAAGREDVPFGTGHLLFARIDDSYERALDVATESLSRRYAMDFRKAAARYAALGTGEQVAERIVEFHRAGARHVVVDLVGPYDRRPEQIERFVGEVMPLLADLRVRP